MTAKYLGLGIEGWMSDEDLAWLFSTAQQMDSVIEVGCWKGRSTSALASGCSGKVFAVDHWLGSEAERKTAHREALTADVYAQFLNNMEPFANVVPVRMDSVSAAALLAPAAMVFIDAGHEYEEIRADILAWKPKARKLLCGHDYPFPQVRRAVHELLGSTVRNPTSRIWALELEMSAAG